MTNRAPASPPLVDLTPFRASSPPSPSAAAASSAALLESAASFGYAHVAGHGVPPTVTERVLAASRRFFESRIVAEAGCPGGDRAADRSLAPNVAMSPVTFRGYQRLGENVTLGRRDAHRALDFLRQLPADACLPAGGSPSLSELAFGENVFPDGELGEAVTDFIQAVVQAGRAVMRGVCHALLLPEAALADSFSDPFWLIRLIHYPAAAAAAAAGDGRVTRDELGCGAHRDYGWLTMVVSDEDPGSVAAMQVSKDGSPGGFAPAAVPPAGCFLLNFGDCLEALTHGAFPATLHRVLRPPRDRLSVAVFVEPNFGWRIGALRLPTASPRPLHAARDAAEHRRRLAEMGKYACYGEYLLSKVSSNFSLLPAGSGGEAEGAVPT
jgi:isopenicillin N synthase-like dioxygenase